MPTMRTVDLKRLSTAAYGGLLERVEFLRAKLRWSESLDRAQIEMLLDHCAGLREEVLRLSRTERQRQSEPQPQTRANRSQAERRQGLLERNFIFEGVFGESPKLLETLEIAEKVAPTDLPVLIDGESGTGKELMAKVIHANGKRSKGPFISVNCGAIPHDLVESELFGHIKGAFTGAVSDRKGKFEAATGGTIFLDEIGELPLSGQVKLLRVLQSQEIQKVGSDKVIEIDARVVAATNQNLMDMVSKGAFREDLFYRLSIIHVSVPPLRERRDEIPLLLEYYCDEAAEKLERRPVQLSPGLRQLLERYAYPGNIRELRNIVYRLSCLADDTADIVHLPDAVRQQAQLEAVTPAFSMHLDGNSLRLGSGQDLAEIKKTASNHAEKQYLQKALTSTRGNVAELARRTGMNRSHLQMLLKKHGLRSKDFRAAMT
jgi:transcriptional regulator with GAF, ATPase, and Fis domain